MNPNPNRQYDVITVGESTIDAFMTLAHAHADAHLDSETNGLCFKFGEKIDVERYDFAIGGNATNVAVGLSRLGLKATLCTEIGDDEFSLKIRNCLATEHVERMLVHQVKGQSNFSVAINFRGDRTLFGENVKRAHNFDFLDITAKMLYITSLADEWRKPYETALAFAKKNNAKIAFNPGSRQIHDESGVTHAVLEQTYILIVNKQEAELLLHQKDTPHSDEEYVKKLMQQLQKHGPQIVVVTDGKKGSYALDSDENFYRQHTHEGEVVERTGAGDAYSTGFLAATNYGLPVQKAMEWGSWNATSVVSKIGAQAGLLTKEQMELKVK